MKLLNFPSRTPVRDFHSDQTPNTPFTSVDCARVQTIFNCFGFATKENFTLHRKKMVGKDLALIRKHSREMVGKELLLIITSFPLDEFF